MKPQIFGSSHLRRHDPSESIAEFGHLGVGPDMREAWNRVALNLRDKKL
jgi:hypothetical protein